MTQGAMVLLILVIFTAVFIGRKVWIKRSIKLKSYQKSHNKCLAEFVDGQKMQEPQVKPNLKAYDIQDFSGDRLALIFASDILDAIKKFTDAFSNANKTKYEAHYTFFGEDHALLRMVDLLDFQDGGYLVMPLTIFESNKVEYRSWRPDYKD